MIRDYKLSFETLSNLFSSLKIDQKKFEKLFTEII